MTGFLTGEVGAEVLTQDVPVVDGDDRLDGEGAEVGFLCELAGVPSFVETLVIGFTIIVDFHGVFLFKCV